MRSILIIFVFACLIYGCKNAYKSKIYSYGSLHRKNIEYFPSYPRSVCYIYSTSADDLWNDVSKHNHDLNEIWLDSDGNGEYEAGLSIEHSILALKPNVNYRVFIRYHNKGEVLDSIQLALYSDKVDGKLLGLMDIHFIGLDSTGSSRIDIMASGDERYVDLGFHYPEAGVLTIDQNPTVRRKVDRLNRFHAKFDQIQSNRLDSLDHSFSIYLEKLCFIAMDSDSLNDKIIITDVR